MLPPFIPWSFTDKLGTTRSVCAKFISVRYVRSDSGGATPEMSLEEWLQFVDKHAADPGTAQDARQALLVLQGMVL